MQDREDRNNEGDSDAGGRRGVPPGALRHYTVQAQPGHHARQEEARQGYCTVSSYHLFVIIF